MKYRSGESVYLFRPLCAWCHIVSPLNAERLKEAKFLQLDCGGADVDVGLSKGTVLAESPCSTSESASSEGLLIGIAEEGESLRVSAA